MEEQESTAQVENQESATPNPSFLGGQTQEQDHQAILEAHEAECAKAWQGQVDGWREQVNADPEIGGEKLAATVARAQMALQQFDTQDRFIGKLLEQSGYGNHPEVLRFFNRLAENMLEDNLSAADSGNKTSLPLEERMYSNWN